MNGSNLSYTLKTNVNKTSSKHLTVLSGSNSTDQSNDANTHRISAINDLTENDVNAFNRGGDIQTSRDTASKIRDSNVPSSILSEPEIKQATMPNRNTANRTDKTEIAPLPATDTLKSSGTAKAKKTQPKVQQKSKKEHFYAGLILGPDVSTIKLQKSIRPGLTIGVMAGYKINKKWSIESGFYIDKKYYYTKGKYFNANHLYLPSYVKIEDIDGSCSMTELPLNIRYDFRSGKKVNWFMLAGTSSYFMKKEDYEYRYKSYGVLTEKAFLYRKPSKNWVSVINLGAGYSRRVGQAGTLRIEPYIKVPLKHVGVGSLPITSSGVYLGFTKNLF